MKRFLALAIAVSAVSVHAASDRAIYDVMYLPNAGTTYGFSEIGFLDREIKGANGNGDFDVSAFGIDQTIGHVLTDRLSIQLDMNYVNGEVDPEAGRTIEQSGISDPTVTARFRLMDEVIKLDVVGGVMLGLGASEIENNGDMDNRQGGNAVFAGLQVGEKSENLQWAVFGGLRRNFEREYEFGNADIEFDANNEVLVRADLLNKLAEKSLLRSHLAINFAEEVDTNDSNFTGANLTAPTTVYELGTEYQHLMSQDLLARVGVDYRIENADSATFDSDRALVLTVGANYQF